MAKGKRRRGRRARSRSNASGPFSKNQRKSLTGNPLSRSLRMEALEDRRMLATFTVVNPFDIEDDDGDGTFEIVPGSLRDAVTRANEFADPDTIVFEGFLFEQPTAINLLTSMDEFGELLIEQPVNIVGPGPGKLTINAALGNRVFNILGGDDVFKISVGISGLTLAGGSAIGADEEGQGGAIRNADNLTLTEVEIRNSTASTFGGAVFNDSGNLVVDRSLIQGNTSLQGGGGIGNGIADQTDNLPSTTIVNSTITGNTTMGAPDPENVAGYGGGVLNLAGTVNIEQSTIVDNTASYGGGGVASVGFDPMIEEEDDGMGGMSMVPTVYYGNATLNIRSSIIVGNTLPPPTPADDPIPNDVASIGIVAGDPDADPPTEDAPFQAQINSEGYNLFGEIVPKPLETVNMDVTLPPGGADDLADVDPFTLFLGFPDPDDPENPNRAVPFLTDFGGELPVFMPDPNKVTLDILGMPLTGGNAAIDRGDPSIMQGNYDQRGRHFVRVSDLAGGDMPVMDIGAVEVQNGLFVVDSLLDESDGEHTIGDFTLREAVGFSERNPFQDTIVFSSDLRFEPDPNPFTPAPTIQLTLGELSITQDVDILGPTFQLEIDGTNSSRIFNINDGISSNLISVQISDLTLLNGGGAPSGGAIFSSENLAIDNSYLLNNNSAFNGGALFISQGQATVNSSTFAKNFAPNNGGGIYISDLAGVVNIINTTISENEASNRGAGITNLGTDTNVQYSTITLNNSASTLGSGITNLFNGDLSVKSSIVAGNVNNDIEYFGGAASNITSDGYNLIGFGNATQPEPGTGHTVFVDGVIGDRVDSQTPDDLSPRLAPLLFTGGSTPTHRLLTAEETLDEDSPALDMGDPNAIAGAGGVPLFDQRGSQFDRIFDGDVSGSARIDIGAYELQEIIFTVDSSADENDGDFTPGNFSLREAIEVANASVSMLPETIIFDSSIVGLPISLSPSGLAPFTSPDIKITAPVKIVGPGITINGSGLFDGLGNTFPMFTVDDGNDGSMFGVSFEDLTFVNGSDRAIVSREDLDISGIFATGNNGVFDNTLGNLTIMTSVLTGNTTDDDGGAIVSTDGNLIIEGNPSGYGYSVLSGNSTTVTQGNGGAISFSDNTPDGRTLSLSKVILSGNNAPAGAADGGALYISGNGSSNPSNITKATLVESIVSGNSTTGSNSEGTGIFAKDADVTLSAVTVSLNRSFGTNSKGAAIFLSGGSLTVEAFGLRRSLITQNSTYGDFAPGAGIANIGGDVTLDQVTISRNTTFGIDSHGAGIYSVGGSLTLNGTTINSNEATSPGTKGGGIYSDTNLTGTQKTTIFNSTISGNTATLRGGGAYNADGLMEIQYSTISNNSVPYFGNGGGVASFGNSGTTLTEVRSSIIAGNFSTSDPVNPNSDVDSVAGNVTNSFVSLGYNVIGKGLPLALDAFNQMGDIKDVVDPGLGPLSLANGGLTATHALLPTSPALNAGDPNAMEGVGNVPTSDQRGAGFSRVINGRIDVGAFESDLAPIVPFAPTDFDEDGQVSGFDFLAWQRGVGTPNATKADGDSNNDMVVDGVDLANWEGDYGTSSVVVALAASVGPTSNAVESGPVAESSTAIALPPNQSPSSVVLLGLGSAASEDLSSPETTADASETAAIDESLAQLSTDSKTISPQENRLDDLDLDLPSSTDSDSDEDYSAEDSVFEMLGNELV